MPKRLFTDEQEAEIAREYVTPLSDGTWIGSTALAAKWGTTHQTIFNLLRRQGVAIRTAKEAHSNGKRSKPITHIPYGAPPPCACGCGEPVEWYQHGNEWRKFVRGHYRPASRLYKDEAWLRNAYLNERRSSDHIAQQFGVAGKTVLMYIHRFGIPVRKDGHAQRGVLVGARNPAWKGGTTPERQRLYKKGEWKELVREVLKRDNYTCQRCNTYRATNKPKLVTHHIKPFAGHPELRFDPDNLVTLCEACHVWVHSRANSDNEFC